MRILMITDKMQLGGAETHIFTLASELLRRGHEVGIMSGGGIYSEKLCALGAKAIYAPLDKRTPMALKRAIRAIRINMGLYDVIHAHTRFSAFAARCARGSSAFPAIVCTAHLTFRVRPFRKIAYWGERTLAVSDDIAQYLTREYGVAKNRISITKNGIDTEHFNRREELREGIIVHVSRIDRGRSMCAFLLCDIAEVLLRENKRRRIVIAGDGNDFRRLKAQAEEINSALGYEGIILTGAVSDVKDILENGGIFIGVSRAALEAMAMELPTVICGDEGYGGIYTKEKYAITDASNLCARGLPLADRDKLYRDIKVLLDDPLSAKAIGKESRAHVLERYGSASMADDAIAAYQSVYRKMRPLLIGYIGYDNFGDEAAYVQLKGALNNRGICDTKLLIRTDKTNEPEGLYARFSPLAVRRAVMASDALILCGGNLIQNETGILSLIYYCTIIGYAYRKGRSVYMSGSGIGEIYGSVGAFLVKRALRKVCCVGARTNTDLLAIKHFSPQTKAVIMPDVCFLYGAKSEFHARKYFAIIGTSKGFFDRIDASLISKELGLTPVIILLFEKEDSRHSIEFAERYGIECFCPKTPDEISRRLCLCRFSICERLHGAIFSIICKCAVFLSDESLKNRALIDEIGERCRRLGINSPLFPFTSNEADLEKIKKEIEAQSFDFQKIIDSVKNDVNIALRDIF